jgi:hypothetical protein
MGAGLEGTFGGCSPTIELGNLSTNAHRLCQTLKLFPYTPHGLHHGHPMHRTPVLFKVPAPLVKHHMIHTHLVNDLFILLLFILEVEPSKWEFYSVSKHWYLFLVHLFLFGSPVYQKQSGLENSRVEFESHKHL